MIEEAMWGRGRRGWCGGVGSYHPRGGFLRRHGDKDTRDGEPNGTHSTSNKTEIRRRRQMDKGADRGKNNIFVQPPEIFFFGPELWSGFIYLFIFFHGLK